MAIETASKVGTYYIVVLFAVALAATEAWVMPHVLLQRLRMAIEMSSDGMEVHSLVAAAFIT
jgi:hypothetical protein